MHSLPSSKYAQPASIAMPVPAISKLRQSLGKSHTLINIASVIAALVFVYLGL